MSKLVTITLNSPVGGSVGPTLFLTSDVGVVSPNTATVTQLLAGFIVTLDDAATYVTVSDDGGCKISIQLFLPTTTTSTTTSTTSTTTTTTTACPCNTYQFTGNFPVVTFTFVECNSFSELTIPLGIKQTNIYCVDNSQPITMIGNGTYEIIGDPAECCTITTPTTTSTTSTTTSTTTFNPNNFEIYNNASFGFIQNITNSIGGVFYTITGGASFPISSFGGYSYGTHTAFADSIKVTITDRNSGNIAVYVNSLQVGCINTTGTGTYTITGISFSSTDLVQIIYSYGPCV